MERRSFIKILGMACIAPTVLIPKEKEDFAIQFKLMSEGMINQNKMVFESLTAITMIPYGTVVTFKHGGVYPWEG